MFITWVIQSSIERRKVTQKLFTLPVSRYVEKGNRAERLTLHKIFNFAINSKQRSSIFYLLGVNLLLYHILNIKTQTVKVYDEYGKNCLFYEKKLIGDDICECRIAF